jgi:hypothetical protein
MAYNSTNPNTARYDRPSELPAPPTTCSEYDEAHRRLTEARTNRHALRERRSQVEREIRKADETYLVQAAEDVIAGKPARKDPRPALAARRERLVAEEAVARQVQNELADTLDAVVASNADAWLTQERAKRDDLAHLAEEQLEAFVQAIDEAREVAALVSWLGGGQLHAAPIGTKEVNALRKAVAELINPPRVRYVDGRNMALLQQRQQAVTLDGEVLPAGTSPASVRLSHSPQRLYQVGGQEVEIEV